MDETPSQSAASFLRAPAPSPELQRLFDEDVEQMGFVMNVSRLWGHLPAHHDALFELIGSAAAAAGLSFRERGVMVTAAASTLGDSYCALAWGHKLAGAAGAEVAVGALTGTDETLTAREQALATWTRRVSANPNAATADDVAALREAGFDDAQVLALTLFVSLRLAFSTVNDALGARPDREMADTVPEPVQAAVTWGRAMVRP